MNKMYYKEYRKRKPWAQALFSARARCKYDNSSYRCYKKKNIKCFITFKEIEEIWFRDNGFDLERPSLDRIDSNEDYTYENCRFIEYKINALEGSRQAGIVCSVEVEQFKNDDIFVKSFKSLAEAGRELGDVNYKHNIWKCCQGKRLSAYGFIWRYKKHEA